MKISNFALKSLESWEARHHRNLKRSRITYSHALRRWSCVVDNELRTASTLALLVTKNPVLITTTTYKPRPIRSKETKRHTRDPILRAYEQANYVRFYGSGTQYRYGRWECRSTDGMSIVTAATLEALIAKCPYIIKSKRKTL